MPVTGSHPGPTAHLARYLRADANHSEMSVDGNGRGPSCRRLLPSPAYDNAYEGPCACRPISPFFALLQ